MPARFVPQSVFVFGPIRDMGMWDAQDARLQLTLIRRDRKRRTLKRAPGQDGRIFAEGASGMR